MQRASSRVARVIFRKDAGRRGSRLKHRTSRAGTRSRQQCRSGPQGAQEEDAARGNFSRDEASRSLREAVRKEGARKGGGGAARAEAGAQEVAARRLVAGQGQARRRAPLGGLRPPARMVWAPSIAAPESNLGQEFGPRWR